MRLNPSVIERLKSGVRRDIKDALAPGLYLRIEAAGRKVFRYRCKISGKVRVITLGSWPDMTLGAARALAIKHREAVLQGGDPAAEARAAKAARRRMPTVEAFIDEYLRRYAYPRKKSAREDETMLRRWVVPRIGQMRMDRVHRRDIVAILDAIRDAGRVRMPGKILAVTRRMFRFAVERGVLEQSPMLYIAEPARPPARKAMDIATARRLWAKTGEILDAAGDVDVHPTVALALRLLLLTGQRPGEVCRIEARDVRLDGPEPCWTIPAEKRKGARPHGVALTGEAVAILRSMTREAFVFPMPGRTSEPIRSWHLNRAMTALLGEGAPTPHACRHTVATELEALGFDELEIARVLGHASAGITGKVYINRRSVAVQRRAMQAWEGQLLGRDEGNVLPIREGIA